MADLLSILSGAASSLAAQRALQATASHNVENANTPGYARQRAQIETVAPGEMVRGAFVGSGAILAGITQARDRFVEAQIPNALGAAAASAAESEALAAVHALDPSAPGGVGAALGAFYSGLRALAQDPSNASLRSAAFGAAQGLATTFRRTRGAIEDARAGLDARLSGLAEEANGEAAAVADLNGRIRAASGSGATPNDLLDLRQRHLDRLAELTGGSPVASSQGDVNVALPGGATLVSGTSAGALSVAPAAAGAHPELRFVPPGAGSSMALGAAPGGALGGALAARDGALARAVSGLDQLAYDLVTTQPGGLNDVHAAGYDLEDRQGASLFSVGAGPEGAAAHLKLSIADPSELAAASGPGAHGDASNLQALIGTEDLGLGSSGATAEGTFSALVAGFGASAERAKALADQDGAFREHLTAMRESVSGVSIDDEMIAMQQAQRGYEAITRVIQVADSMMETLMKLR